MKPNADGVVGGWRIMDDATLQTRGMVVNMVVWMPEIALRAYILKAPDKFKKATAVEWISNTCSLDANVTVGVRH